MLKYLPSLVLLSTLCGCVGTEKEDLAAIEENNKATGVTDKTNANPAGNESDHARESTAGAVDSDAAHEFTATPSGLKYRILRKSDGKKPGASSTVRVHYRGWIPDQDNPDQGREFDSSYARGEPISFPLADVIAGWTEGMQLVKEGGMIELDIPSALAYGPQGRPGIPPNTNLRFIVELLEVR